jgi:hypothetical protein
MALEQLKAEIAMLVQQMDREPEDVHELHARIRQKLAEFRATGQPLPDDLVALERRLDAAERAPARERAATTGQQAPAAAPRRPAARTRRAPAKKAAPKKAKRPAARKAAAASRRTAAKKSRRPVAKAKKSSARRAKRSARGRR